MWVPTVRSAGGGCVSSPGLDDQGLSRLDELTAGGAGTNPLTVSAARFVAQGRSVVGASVNEIACAPTDLVGPKVSALLGWGLSLFPRSR